MKRLIVLLALLALAAFYAGWPAYSGYQIDTALKSADAAMLERKIDFPAVREGLAPLVKSEISTRIDRYISEKGPLAAIFGPSLKEHYLPLITSAALNSIVTPNGLIRLYAERDHFNSAIFTILKEEIRKNGTLPGLSGQQGVPNSKSPSDRFNLPFGTAQYGESLKKLEAAAGAAGAQGKIPDVNEVLKAILEKGPTGAEGAGPAESTAKAPAAPQAFGISNVKHFGFNGPFAMEVGLAKDGTAAKSDVTAEIGFSGGDWKLTKLVAGP